MFRRLIERFAGKSISFQSWILSVIGMISIRIFLESYSSFQPDHFVLIDVSTILHYLVFYIVILLLCNAILVACTKLSVGTVSALSLAFFPIIWLPPLIDLAVSGGRGYLMSYLFLQKGQLLSAFLTEFWSTSISGVTIGIRIEVLIIVVFFFATIYVLTKSKLRAAAGAISMYFVLFIIAALPSLLALFQNGPVFMFLAMNINHSSLLNNLIYPLTSTTALRFFDIGFNAVLTQIEILIGLVALIVIFAKGSGTKFKSVLKNVRPEKTLFYLVLIIIGVLLGNVTVDGFGFFDSWINILSLVMILLSFTFAWLASVCINDIYDVDIDMISNKNRPLPMGTLSKNELYLAAHIFIVVACLTAFTTSAYSLFFVILFLMISYIYSAEPLRLRQYFPVGNLLIGLAGAIAFLSGFFLSHQNQNLIAFSPLNILLIIIALGAVSMVKDIKDHRGDKANGVKTLPTLISLPAAKTVIAVCISTVFICISIYLHNSILIGAAVLASAATWKIFFSKVYCEFHFFIVYTAYMLMVVTVLVP